MRAVKTYRVTILICNEWEEVHIVTATSRTAAGKIAKGGKFGHKIVEVVELETAEEGAA